jgi:hypothetical protein
MRIQYFQDQQMSLSILGRKQLLEHLFNNRSHASVAMHPQTLRIDPVPGSTHIGATL